MKSLECAVSQYDRHVNVFRSALRFEYFGEMELGPRVRFGRSGREDLLLIENSTEPGSVILKVSIRSRFLPQRGDLLGFEEILFQLMYCTNCVHAMQREWIHKTDLLKALLVDFFVYAQCSLHVAALQDDTSLVEFETTPKQVVASLVHELVAFCGQVDRFLNSSLVHAHKCNFVTTARTLERNVFFDMSCETQSDILP